MEKLKKIVASGSIGSDGNRFRVRLMRHGLNANGFYFPESVFVRDFDAFKSEGKPLRAYLDHSNLDEKFYGARFVENLCGHYEEVRLNSENHIEGYFSANLSVPAGSIALGLVKSGYVDVSTTLLAAYHEATDEELEKYGLGSDCLYIVDVIGKCLSCDIVPDGAAGGEFILNSGYDFSDGRLINLEKSDNITEVRESMSLTLEELISKYPDIVEQVRETIKSEILNDIEVKGKTKSLKDRISELEDSIVSIEKDREDLVGKHVSEVEKLTKENVRVENLLRESLDENQRYKNAVVASNLVNEEAPNLSEKQRDYLITQLLNCESEESMRSVISELLSVFSESLKNEGSTVVDNGAPPVKKDVTEDLISEDFFAIKHLLRDKTGINEDGNYTPVKLEGGV